MCQPNDGFPRPGMRTVGRQTPQLCARKVCHNEARSLSHTFGKHELNLGITQSPSTRELSRTSRRCDHNDGEEQHAPARPSCAARPVAEADCTKISQQITDESYVRALCDADVN